VRRSGTDGFTQAASGDIMARRRLDYRAVEQMKSLLITRSAVESSGRPTAVVGQRLSGKSRFTALGATWEAAVSMLRAGAFWV